ncbi:MAG: ABC transporter permease, partial [Bacteroidota bacterium]
MLKNYFKTAFRNLIRNKTYTAINVLGLSIGIAVCLVIFLIIRFETGFDAFHTKKDRIYRVLTEFNDGGVKSLNAGVPFPLPKTIKSDFPQLEKVAAIYSADNSQLSVMDEKGEQSLKKF